METTAFVSGFGLPGLPQPTERRKELPRRSTVLRGHVRSRFVMAADGPMEVSNDEEPAMLLPSSGSDSPSEMLSNVGQVSTESGFVLKDRMAIQFTCNICQAKTKKSFTRRAYEQGVVIVRCSQCRQQHLIADHLDYFPHLTEDGETVEEHANARGIRCTRASVDALKFEELVRDDRIDLNDWFVPKHGDLPSL